MDDDLEDRLRRLGSAPVPPQLAERHLSAMAAVEAGGAVDASGDRPRWRFGWKAVAAAGVVGFLAGSTGLAAAGELPGPAQDVAHDVLGAVGIDVPRSTDACPEGRTYRNHGDYVSEVEAAGGDVGAAARSSCGMPVGGGAGRGPARSAGVPRADADGDPCTGPPPWAGTHLPRAQREQLQAERRAACGEAGDDEAADQGDPTTTTAG